MLLKNCVCQLVAKVNDIDTRGFALKIKYETDKLDLEKKFLTVVGLLKKQIIKLKLLKQKVKYLAQQLSYRSWINST